ncbi:hypothetical protein LF844_10885 [Metapseudomonas lalkuanensis]|nr:hypothetical protein [Pseudomonas lalkuanensis]UCP00284.1 hypothetical protein LF844_10885 [Pseudomonas lalkuanensis]
MKKLTLGAMVLTSLLTATAFASQFDKPGFVTEVDDGRLSPMWAPARRA